MAVRRFPIMPVVAGCLMVLAASGCSRISDIKGYIADEALITAIQPGVDNRDSVQRTLGRPSLVSEFDPKVWYYVSRRTEQLAFLRPTPTEHRVTVVTFNDKGQVATVEQKGVDQLVSVDPADGKTPTRGKEVGFWQDLFGGVGTFAPAGAGGGPQ
jgi:outer membrane protein assembly factor BamE (lipoprotein component of BamABCDE complex)